MFSLERFYNLLHDNLVSVFKNGNSIYFVPFGTLDHPVRLKNDFDNGLAYLMTPFTKMTEHPFACYFLDQEPLSPDTFTQLDKFLIVGKNGTDPRCINIIANSEHSDLLSQFIKNTNFYSWYYFYHGFAALDWYRDFRYISPKSFLNFDKVFICYNHLTAGSRSYRLHLAAELKEANVLDKGYVSLFPDSNWEIDCPLDPKAVDKVKCFLKSIDTPLIIDTQKPNGELSAKVSLDSLTKGLWHIVTETVFFDSKLHLTEKIFKPIVAKRPFILAGAPGNLAYLRSYGFKTFDRWIDESYDDEPDHYVRIEKIAHQVKRICQQDPAGVYAEMQETLEYNFNHFYNGFRDLIVNELVDNFYNILCRINNGRQPNNHSRYHQRYDIDPYYLAQVKKRLQQ